MRCDVEFLSSGDVAKLAGVSRETVNYWVRRGLAGWRLPAAYCAGSYIVRRRDVERFLAMRQQQALIV
jgi:hypothetical protein